jgi:SNF2 family DNA or RNA helicase
MATLPQTLTPYQVDLNPHQIDAALFSFKSPLSCGVLLADEVGLGKTIEVGLVLAQRWADASGGSLSSRRRTFASSGTRN